MNELQTGNSEDFETVLGIIKAGKAKAIQTVNTALLETYWEVGELISARVAAAKWGKGIVKQLAQYLSKQAPDVKGFSAQNLWRMKQFYEVFSADEKLSALPRVLSWTHYCTIASQCKSPEERLFYTISTQQAGWSTRELEKQIRAGAFERVLLANQKLSALPRVLPEEASGVFKDSYLLDFLDLPAVHKEPDLQAALVQNLRQFLLELGDGFAFVGEKTRVQVGMQDFELDLLFYHRDLQCLVAFELKVGRFKPEHLGKLNFYLEALDRDRKREHENPSIGVLLCRGKDDEVVEYAMSRTLSPAMVAEYETKMIPKKILQQKLHEWNALLESKTDSKEGDA